MPTAARSSARLANAVSNAMLKRWGAKVCPSRCSMVSGRSAIAVPPKISFIGNHANDGPPRGQIVGPKFDSQANGVLAGEKRVRRGFIQNNRRTGAVNIRTGKFAAFEQGKAHCSKVIGADGVEDDIRSAVRVNVRVFRGDDGTVDLFAAWRDGAGHGNGTDSGNGVHALEHLAVEAFRLRRFPY